MLTFCASCGEYMRAPSGVTGDDNDITRSGDDISRIFISLVLLLACGLLENIVNAGPVIKTSHATFYIN